MRWDGVVLLGDLYRVCGLHSGVGIARISGAHKGVLCAHSSDCK